jgi:hypothetical protein
MQIRRHEEHNESLPHEKIGVKEEKNRNIPHLSFSTRKNTPQKNHTEK